MISCQKCLHENPLGSTFCHGCGTRLVVNLADIERSVIGTRKNNLDERILQAGLSAIALTTFLLVTALILRFCLVPAMPTMELPSPVLGPVFPQAAPAWTARAPVAQTAVVQTPSSSPRLAWRRAQAGAILAGVGIDLTRISLWQSTLLLAQEADGSVKASDTLAATALVAAALQAAPLTTASEAGASKARAYLHAHSEHLTQEPSLTRSLVALALLDAQDLSDIQRAALSVYLVNGESPFWQAYLLALYPNEQRPALTPALTSAWTTGVAADFFALVAGRPPTLAPGSYARTAIPVTGEERMLWAFTAWNNPIAPKEIIDTLHALSALDAAPVTSELNKACGATATTAVGLLTLCAPMHVPPLWLTRGP